MEDLTHIAIIIPSAQFALTGFDFSYRYDQKHQVICFENKIP